MRDAWRVMPVIVAARGGYCHRFMRASAPAAEPSVGRESNGRTMSQASQHAATHRRTAVSTKVDFKKTLERYRARAGRFDRQVLVDRPDKVGRVAILKVHTRKIRLADDIHLDEIAALAPGFTGADLANLVNEAALIATRRGAEAVTAAEARLGEQGRVLLRPSGTEPLVRVMVEAATAEQARAEAADARLKGAEERAEVGVEAANAEKAVRAQQDAEKRAASSVKDRKHMSYKEWATKRLQRYYEVVEMLFSPDLLVVGGGVSKDHEKFFKYLDLQTPIVPATLLNRAGIIGAAWQAQWRLEHPDATEKQVVKAARKAENAS